MSKDQEKRIFRYHSLINIHEPHEMTYWKQKLNTPFRRVLEFIRHLAIVVLKRSHHSHS